MNSNRNSKLWIRNLGHNFNLSVCCVCFEGFAHDIDQLLCCNDCNLRVHKNCYHILNSQNNLTKSSIFRCQRCSFIKQNDMEFTNISCAFCPNLFGLLRMFHYQKLLNKVWWCHLVCAQSIPQIVIKTSKIHDKLSLQISIKSPDNFQKRSKLYCYICQDKNKGFALECQWKGNQKRGQKCQKGFHVTCGINQRLLYYYPELNNLLTRNNDSCVINCKFHLIEKVRNLCQNNNLTGQIKSSDARREIKRMIDYFKNEQKKMLGEIGKLKRKQSEEAKRKDSKSKMGKIRTAESFIQGMQEKKPVQVKSTKRINQQGKQNQRVNEQSNKYPVQNELNKSQIITEEKQSKHKNKSKNIEKHKKSNQSLALQQKQKLLLNHNNQQKYQKEAQINQKRKNETSINRFEHKQIQQKERQQKNKQKKNKSKSNSRRLQQQKSSSNNANKSSYQIEQDQRKKKLLSDGRDRRKRLQKRQQIRLLEQIQEEKKKQKQKQERLRKQRQMQQQQQKMNKQRQKNKQGSKKKKEKEKETQRQNEKEKEKQRTSLKKSNKVQTQLKSSGLQKQLKKNEQQQRLNNQKQDKQKQDRQKQNIQSNEIMQRMMLCEQKQRQKFADSAKDATVISKPDVIENCIQEKQNQRLNQEYKRQQQQQQQQQQQRQKQKQQQQQQQGKYIEKQLKQKQLQQQPQILKEKQRQQQRQRQQKEQQQRERYDDFPGDEIHFHQRFQFASMKSLSIQNQYFPQDSWKTINQQNIDMNFDQNDQEENKELILNIKQSQIAKRKNRSRKINIIGPVLNGFGAKSVNLLFNIEEDGQGYDYIYKETINEILDEAIDFKSICQREREHKRMRQLK